MNRTEKEIVQLYFLLFFLSSLTIQGNMRAKSVNHKWIVCYGVEIFIDCCVVACDDVDYYMLTSHFSFIYGRHFIYSESVLTFFPKPG